MSLACDSGNMVKVSEFLYLLLTILTSKVSIIEEITFDLN